MRQSRGLSEVKHIAEGARPSEDSSAGISQSNLETVLSRDQLLLFNDFNDLRVLPLY